MGDHLVDDVLKTFREIAFANGIELPRLRPVVDQLVNRFRNKGWGDDLIRDELCR